MSHPTLTVGSSDNIDLTAEAWQDRALCAQTDPDAFFPDKGESNRAAKAICGRCPVTDDCLEYALAHDLRFGVWGGLSERQRRDTKRARQALSSSEDRPDLPSPASETNL